MLERGPMTYIIPTLVGYELNQKKCTKLTGIYMRKVAIIKEMTSIENMV